MVWAHARRTPVWRFLEEATWCATFSLSCFNPTLLLGHSCTIGNMHVPGTSENQNRQFHEIHHFCPIFTFEYYIVAQKHIRQS